MEFNYIPVHEKEINVLKKKYTHYQIVICTMGKNNVS